MKVKTPSFWYKKQRGWQSVLLAPFAALYGLGRALHCLLAQPRAVEGVHVICVGNVNAGGSGKTPTALALMALLKECKLAKRPVFLLRGYGTDVQGAVQVDLSKHSAADVGDEALLLAQAGGSGGDVYVARNRYEGALYAAQHGADVIIMDDGMQNRQLLADTYMMVIDSVMRFGNGAMLPAGPLREPLSKAMGRAHCAVSIGGAAAGLSLQGKPVFAAHLHARGGGDFDKAQSYVAVSGIAYPDKFFNYLRDDLHLNIVDNVSYPDHYDYSASDMLTLIDKALIQKVKIITTEKDFVKMQALDVDLSLFDVLRVDLRFDQEGALATFLQERIGAR